MKKLICLLLAVCLIFALAACGKTEQENEPTDIETPEVTEAPSAAEEAPAPTQEDADWTRQGYFQDENEYMLSVTRMDDVDEPGWYVGCLLGEDWIEDAYGGTLPQEGNALHGTLPSSGEKESLTVTVTEEGEDGLLLVVDGGGTYHFTPMEMEEATIFVTVNVDGWGNIDSAEGEETPEIDPEYPFQSAQINLAEPTTYTLIAWPQAGNLFVKWTKNGEDYSTEPQITVLLDESADYVAVFEEDPGWQNPVMNFIGPYVCDRARAQVECFGNEDALITIDWANSAWELARWTIVGRLDPDTLTVAYSGCTKQIIVFDEDGEIESEETEYEDGTGTITFSEGGLFTWHEDQADREEDLVFEWSFEPEA